MELLSLEDANHSPGLLLVKLSATTAALQAPRVRGKQEKELGVRARVNRRRN